jgi:photosystem II stability/assembly factor-like uncharacterized protein
MFVGTRKGLFTFQKEGIGWQLVRRAFIGVEVPIFMSDPRDGALYAVAEHGHFGIKLHRSEDGGENWKEITTPSYPPKPEGIPDVLCPFRKIPIPWSLEKLWALTPGGADQPGVLWAGTIPGGLFKSEDRGASWELVSSLWDRPERAKWAGGGFDYPGIHSVCIDPRNSNHVKAAISCGGVWATEDGGETWRNCAEGMRADYAPPEHAQDPDIQDPHLMTQCAGAPDTFWVQHHNGIFKTSDNCQKWEAVENQEPSDFGFAVAVHPGDPDTAWFVPAEKDECRVPVNGKVVVTRTRDGGKSFESLTAGLPQEDAYDLVFRHALSVAANGMELAFGSTSGSVWWSIDQGDSWSQLSGHLPPVYCVEIA